MISGMSKIVHSYIPHLFSNHISYHIHTVYSVWNYSIHSCFHHSSLVFILFFQQICAIPTSRGISWFFPPLSSLPSLSRLFTHSFLISSLIISLIIYIQSQLNLELFHTFSPLPSFPSPSFPSLAFYFRHTHVGPVHFLIFNKYKRYIT